MDGISALGDISRSRSLSHMGGQRMVFHGALLQRNSIHKKFSVPHSASIDRQRRAEQGKTRLQPLHDRVTDRADIPRGVESKVEQYFT